MSCNISKGDRIVLRTTEAIYSFCDVMLITPQKLQVRYCKRVETNKETREPEPVFATDVIDRSKVVYMKQLL